MSITEYILRCIWKWIVLDQKDTHHLTVIWMTWYGMDYLESERPFCEGFIVAFVLWILQQ
jgi:hypothetical protein